MGPVSSGLMNSEGTERQKVHLDSLRRTFSAIFGQMPESTKRHTAHHDVALRELEVGQAQRRTSTHSRGLPGKPGEASSLMNTNATYGRKPAPLFDGCRLSSPLHQGIQAR